MLAVRKEVTNMNRTEARIKWEQSTIKQWRKIYNEKVYRNFDDGQRHENPGKGGSKGQS